eukprot:g8497.t1
MSTTSEEQNKSGVPSGGMNNSRSASFGSQDSVADLYETPNNQLYRGERSSRQTQNENGQPAGAKIGGGGATQHQETNYRTFADHGGNINIKAGAAQGNDSEEETFLGSLTRRASYLHFDVPILSFNERERPSARSSGSQHLLDEHSESAPASARESDVGAMTKASTLKTFAEARVFFRSQMTPDNEYMWDGPRQVLPMLFFFLLLLFATVVAPVLYWYGGGTMPPLRKILDKDRTPFGDEIDGTRTIVFSPLLFTARFIEQDLSGEKNFEKWEAQAVAPIDDSTGRKNLFPNYHEGPGSRFKWAQMHILFHCLIAAWGIITLAIMKYMISWWPLVSYTMQSWTMFTLRHLVAAILLVFSRCGVLRFTVFSLPAMQAAAADGALPYELSRCNELLQQGRLTEAKEAHHAFSKTCKRMAECIAAYQQQQGLERAADKAGLGQILRHKPQPEPDSS